MRAAARKRTVDTWYGVVKVQRSLEVSDGGPEQCLIYNEDRSIMHQQDMPPKLKAMFRGGEPKFYANATLTHGVLEVNDRTTPQVW